MQVGIDFRHRVQEARARPREHGLLGAWLAVVLRMQDVKHPHPGRRLVDEIYGFVRKEAVRHIACGQARRGAERLIGDLQPVVLLIAGADAAQDLERLLLGRLTDIDWLEPALKR